MSTHSFTSKDKHWFEENVLDRFLRYVRMDTTADGHAKTSPSTPGQLELGRLLVGELTALGVEGAVMDDGGFVFASLPGNLPAGVHGVPEIAFMAHLDTSPAAPGKNVKPLVHRDYDGGAIRLPGGPVLDPETSPELEDYRGKTLITSDGTTLLGGDDKAGIAEIMAALEYLHDHPGIVHAPLQVIFTPDEELGLSMERFPVEKFSARYGYTIDGGNQGHIEAECFEAVKAKVAFRGVSIHTGSARGRLVNAVEMAARYVDLLPGAESPQATDGRYGFYVPMEIRGNIEEAEVEIFLRDFEEAEVKRRADVLKKMARAVEALHPGGHVKVKLKKQYANMHKYLAGDPRVLGLLEEAVRATGIEPVQEIIRGGTDGARLSELGIPSPNVFTGVHNMHSRTEWAALEAMVRASQTVVGLARLWAERGGA
jgi:tripeptide aminopeptidase